MLKITRVTDTETITLMVSGRIRAEELPDLRRSVETEPTRAVVLDLSEVSLVDVEVARFDPYLPVLAVPARLREAARRLARTDLFAPMWYSIGSRPRANG